MLGKSSGLTDLSDSGAGVIVRELAAAGKGGIGGVSRKWFVDWAKMRAGETMADYTDEHARAGIKDKLPKLDTWDNQFPGYVITTRYPEYTSVCPKTGLPDYGTLTIEYMPRKSCIELKALKMYLLAYRNLGIFYENAVNKMLEDIVAAIRPEWCVVRGEFTPRGGLNTTIEARWPRKRK